MIRQIEKIGAFVLAAVLGFLMVMHLPIAHAQSNYLVQGAEQTAVTLQNWSTTTVTVTWPAPFADGSYAVSCTTVDSVGNKNRARVARLRSVVAADVTVLVVNDDLTPGNNSPVDVQCVGV